MRNAQIKRSNRDSVKMMLPFALIVTVFVLFMFRFLGSAGSGADVERPQITCAEGATLVTVAKGDTCWEIAQAHGVGLEELLAAEGNEGVDCDALKPGHGICVPA